MAITMDEEGMIMEDSNKFYPCESLSLTELEFISGNRTRTYYEGVLIDKCSKMATPGEHLVMSDWYYNIADAEFQKAKSSKQLSDKSGHFAISAECLLVSTDHLIGWFTKSDEFSSRKGRRNSFINHPKIRKLEHTKREKIMRFLGDVEDVRNRILYLPSTHLDEVEFTSITELKPLLRRCSGVYETIKRI